MELLDLITTECVKAPLDATDKRGVIDELVDLLEAAGKVRDPAALKEAVWSREQIRTTGIGHGLAIPHGRSDGVDDLVMAIGKPASPMEFEAIDGQPVRLVVLLASPPDKTLEHIHALASINKLMTDESFRTQIYDAESGEAIFQLLSDRQKSA